MLPALNPDSDIVAAIRSGAEITFLVPDDLPSLQLYDALKQCGVQIERTGRYGRALKYAMGKMMSLAAGRPSFLKEVGFERFGDFEDNLIAVTGIDRSTLWSWKAIAGKLPALSRDHLANISRESLSLIVRHVPESKQPRMLDAAATMTYRKLKVLAEEEGLVGADEIDGASLIVSASKAKIAELRAYIESKLVREFVGTSDNCEILLAMLGEVQSGNTGWPKL